MDFIEYAEKITGRKMTDHEKKTVKVFKKLHDRGAVVVMGRKGPIWFDRDGNVIKLTKDDFA